jgi:putative endopeptidase
MWIIESSLGLPSKEYYLDPEKKEVRDAYVSFISKLWSLADFSNPSLSAQNILALETQIAYHSELVSAKRNRKDYKTVPNLRTFNELPSNWSWHDYFESLGEDWLNCGDIDVLSVSNPPHLEFVTNLMGPHLQELELLRHYTKWRILLTYSPFLSREFVNAHFNFFGKVLEGRQQPVDRWVWMLEFLNEQAGQLLGELYCDHYFSASSKNQVTEIANTIVEELKATVSNLDWMESNTKAHVDF